MAKIRAQVTGLRDLGEALQMLGLDVSKRIIFNATLRAANIVALRARVNAPRSEKAHKVGKKGPVVQPGNLARGIAVKRLKENFQGRAAYEVRWKHQKAGDPFYGLFVEFGTVKQAATPFMRPAFESTKNEALKEIQDTLARRIRLANKRVKK